MHDLQSSYPYCSKERGSERTTLLINCLLPALCSLPPLLLHCLYPSIPPSECTSVCVELQRAWLCVCVCVCNTHKGLACARLRESERGEQNIWDTGWFSIQEDAAERAAHHPGVSVGVSIFIILDFCGGRFWDF